MNIAFTTTRNLVVVLAAVSVLFNLSTTEAIAQKKVEKGKSNDPEVVELITADSVKLKCEYYPGNNGKETVPIILLHQWDDKRDVLLPMAGYLQKTFGHAVIVPDLRGHGQSVHVVGSTDKLERDRWRADEIAAMLEDIEACKKFLMKKNNEGELNIDLLTVVAQGETTIQALAWTLRDWSYVELGGMKQGQDVKAVIIIHPKRTFKGLNAIDGLKHPLFTGRGGMPLPMMIAANTKKTRESKSIYDALLRGRKAADMNDPELDFVKYKIERRQKVVGTRDKRSLDVVIGEFVKDRVNARKNEFRWQDRSKK